jgi:hypothetical protein
MGYQNAERPEDVESLICDIKCDLSDLRFDIKNGSLQGQGLINAIIFIEKSVIELNKLFNIHQWEQTY